MMQQLANMRKASIAAGDDITLTRWIKGPGRHSKPSKVAPMPADATGTRFPSRVLRVDQMSNLLVSGHSNVKIGRDVRKGRFKGYWIYTLSLEERATCPKSCGHWRDCYGGSMPFGKRIDHTDPAFLPALEAEIARLLSVRGRKGILIRLHALGDFYSVEYVEFWMRMLATHPNLAIFGYTAREAGPECDIKLAITLMNLHYDPRSMIRSSGYAGGWGMGAVSIAKPEDCPPNAFVCPEQTGRVAACALCGACWTGTKTVAFLAH